MELPKDPAMLFSGITMKLRDTYGSLDELCRKRDIDQDWLTQTLAAAGFEYSKANNKFW